MSGPPPKSSNRQRRNSRSTTSTLVSLPSAHLGTPPAPPAGLRFKETKQRWADFWASPVSAAVDMDSDMGALWRWIRFVDESHTLRRIVSASPMVEGSQGQSRMHPLFSRLNVVEKEIADLEASFGMTPIARLRLGIALGGAAASLEGLMTALAEEDDDDPRDEADPREVVPATSQVKPTRSRT